MLRKKLVRTILEKKAQFLSAWFLVVIGSMVFYSFTVTGANLIDNLDYFFKKNQVEDAQFRVQKPLEDIPQLEKQSHVEIEQRYTVDLSYTDGAVLRLLDAPDQVNQYSVVEGKELHSKEDILLDQGFAKAHDLKIGDQVHLNHQRFVVRGFMAIPDYIYPLKSTSGFLKNPEAFGVGLVQEEVVEGWQGSHLYYSVRFLDGTKDSFKKKLNERNQVLQWIDRKDNNRISFIKGDIAGVKQMGESLPIGIFFISLVIILILLWRLMKKEYVQIGTLAALGFKKREIILHYLSYAGILAITGSVIGTVLGWLLLHPLLDTFAAFYNLPVLRVEPHWWNLLMSLLLPLVLFVPFTYYLVHRVLKIPPVTLIKGGELKVKVNFLERFFKLKKMKFTRKFMIREILRNVPRTLFLVIGVVFATLLLLFGFIMKNSMQYLVTDNYQSVYHYHYEYILNGLESELPASGQIGSVAPFTMKVNDEKQSVTIYGLEPENSAIRLKDISGKKLTFNSVIVNQSLAEKVGLHKGDTVEVTNQLTNMTFKVRIDQIADSYLGDIMYMPLEKFNEENGYPSGSYSEIFSDKELSIPDSKLVSVTKSADTINGFKQLLQPLNTGIAGIAVVAGVIAVTIIYILISLMIEENSYKISLMKVMGYRDVSIRKMMIGYHVWFVLLGFLLGIPVTLFSISAFMDSITAEMNLSIPVKVDGISLAISLVILLAAYYISIWLNNKKLKNIQIKEAINRSTE